MKINEIIINRDLSVNFSGHGHYKITGLVYGKPCYYIETDMTLIDNFKDDSKHKSNGAARILLKRLTLKNRVTV